MLDELKNENYRNHANFSLEIEAKTGVQPPSVGV